MPTSAAYAVIIGEDRIVSAINDNGAGVALPKIDTTGGGLLAEPKSRDKGNRKIILSIEVNLEEQSQEIRPEDRNISIRVKVPAGIIRDRISRFKFDGLVVPGYSTNFKDYIPLMKVFPNTGTNGAIGTYTIDAKVYATLGGITPPNAPDEETQTVVVSVRNGGGANPLAFILEIDWQHSINN